MNNCRYVPMSQTNLAFIASIVPSLATPTSTSAIRSRPCVVAARFSRRVDPLDGLAQSDRKIRCECFFAIDIELAAKAAADLGGDHASRFSARLSIPARALRNRCGIWVDDQSVVPRRPMPLRDDASCFNRHRGEALINHAESDYAMSLLHRLFDARTRDSAR